MSKILFQITKSSTLAIVFFLLFVAGLVLFLMGDAQKNRSLFIQQQNLFIGKANDSIETYARQQARYMAKGIGECIKKEVARHGIGTDKDLADFADICGSAFRSGGPTGDFFVVDLTTHKFVYDGSPDCMKGGDGRKLSYDSECYMHKDKTQCKNTITEMYKSYNTDENSRQWWNFDGSPEWLEWYIIPDERTGFIGPIGVFGKTSLQNRQLAVVMGTQKDEVYDTWGEAVDYFRSFSDIGKSAMDSVLYLSFPLTLIICIFAVLFVWREKQCQQCPNNPHK